MPSPRRVLITASLLALTTATACQHHASIDPQPAHPMADGLPNGKTRGTIDLPVIDLMPGESRQTTFEATIIDTTTFPVVEERTPAWRGDTKRPGTLLPAHSRDKSLLENTPNGLTAGGTTDRVKINPGKLFPAIEQTAWSPPDPSVAVGPNHIVVTVNMAVAFYDREGNEQFFSNLDSTGDPGFFEDVGAGDFTFDPKCFYDPFIERYVILALEVYTSANEGWITIAISDDDDPNGTWYKYRTWAVINQGGSEFWPDYPGLGFDSNAFYCTNNLFGFSGGFAGVLYRVFPKAPMLVGDPVTVTDLVDGGASSVQVAQCLDPRNTPLFVSRQNQNTLRLQSIRNLPSGPVIETASVDVPAAQNPNQDAPNAGGGTLDTLDGRIMNVMWRNNGLWLAHAIRGTGDNTKARWYHINDAGFPFLGNPILIQSGDIDLGAGNFAFFPAIAVNGVGDAAIVFAKAAAGEFPSIQATGRQADDPAGTMGTPVQLAIGDAGSDGRWGDYFDITVDPNNDSTFVMIGEYARDFGWATWVGTLEVSCAGDVNDDGIVNVNDVLSVLAAFGGLGSGGDANGDGTVDVNDVLIVISNWGDCSSP